MNERRWFDLRSRVDLQVCPIWNCMFYMFGGGVVSDEQNWIKIWLTVFQINKYYIQTCMQPHFIFLKRVEVIWFNLSIETF